VKTLSELLNADEPAWPLVQQWIKEAHCTVEILKPSDPARAEALVATQVTTRSPMGALLYETGGLLVDRGWLRILGSGHPRLPRSLPAWNKTCVGFGSEPPPGLLLIADDVIGGFFALDGGALGFNRGDVAYFAPDSLEWENTGLSYSDFLVWTFSGKLESYYKDYRWNGWEGEIASLEGSQGYSILPPPIMKGEPYPLRSRSPIPIEELFGFYQDLGRQLKDVPNGSRVVLKTEPPSLPPDALENRGM
jgi:hypothetical protein